MSRSARLGQFRIGFGALNTEGLRLSSIFEGLVVVHAMARYDLNHIEYVAMGPPFDEVPQGAIAPWYEAVIRREGDKLSVTWVKIGGAS